MYLSVTAVKPLDNYELLITFENREQRRFDCKPLLGRGVFKELAQESVFNSVKVSFDSIEWSNGIDIDPEWLYEKSVPAVYE